MSRLITPEESVEIAELLVRMSDLKLRLAARGINFNVTRDFHLWDPEHGRFYATIGVDEKIEDRRPGDFD